MKQLTLELKKRLLIVEVDDNISTAKNIKIDVGVLKYDVDKYLDGSSNVWICNKKELSGKFELICKGDELTEEIAKELVDLHSHGTAFKNYKGLWVDRCSNALESFISAIEAKGFWWKNNPIERDNIELDDGRVLNVKYNSKEWQEAESKTFNPEKSLIFEIL